jgi:C-terminal processing protease CtpA/Prc
VTLIATPPRIVLDGARPQAAAADIYRQLSLFGDVFERVRANYVERPDDSKLIESAINGMLAGLLLSKRRRPRTRRFPTRARVPWSGRWRTA